MHAIQTHHLPCDLVGAETARELEQDRRTALVKSFGAGVAALAIVAFAGCQQFAGKTGSTAKTPVAQPELVVNAVIDAHDSSWIAQAHAAASKSGSDAAVSDLSY